MIFSINLIQRADGTVVPVRVVPRGGRTSIDGVIDGNLRVRLAAPPVDGAANKELIAYLSRIMRLPKRDIELLHGEKSRTKHMLIRGASAEFVNRQLSLAGLGTLAPEQEQRQRDD